jgi:cell division protein FtsI (penicillin-binding protein 3)
MARSSRPKTQTQALSPAPSAKPAGPRPDGWSLFALGLITVMLLGLFARVTQLQTRPSPELAQHMGDRVSTVAEHGRRGDIYDRRERLLATSRWGFRLIIDPVEFPGRKHTYEDACKAIAEALGEPFETIAQRIAPARARNEAVWREAGYDPEDPKRPLPGNIPGLDRYVFVGPPLLPDPAVDALSALASGRNRIAGITLESREVRELAGEDLMGPIVGKVGLGDNGEPIGKFGVEQRVQDDGIIPTDGSFSFVRDANNRPMWLLPGGYTPAARGRDFYLSIDTEIQRMLQAELVRGVEDADAAGGRAVIIDVLTGDVLAIADHTREVNARLYDFQRPLVKGDTSVRYRVVKPDTEAAQKHPELRRNRVVTDMYEPGSIFKPFLWAAVMGAGLGKPDEMINCFGPFRAPDGREIEDVTKRGIQSARDVLINSSNIGMIKLVARMDRKVTRDTITAFGFGRRTGIEFPGEALGMVTPVTAWRNPTQTSVAIGHEINVTPIQLVRAFAAFCRQGDLAGTIPDISLMASARGVVADGTPAGGRPIHRVLPPWAAMVTRDTMKGVTAKVDKNMAAYPVPETGWRYALFGKSGTAKIPVSPMEKGQRLPRGSYAYYPGQYFSSFIAGGPTENPRLAIVVTIDDPGPKLVAAKQYYGTNVAGPVVRRVMERALAYLGTPASPTAAAANRGEHGGD